MTSPWANFPDELFHEMVKKRYRYILSMRSPLMWSVTAYRLKRAADHLIAVSDEARSEFLRRSREEHQARNNANPPPESLSELEEINLYIDIELIEIYFMLCGLAIENAAKGILIARDPSAISDDGELSRKYKKHKLEQLVADCGLSLSEREEEILRALTQAVLWSGRYPNRLKVFLPERTPDGDFAEQPGLSHKDREEVDHLVERVYQLLGETTHPD